MTREGGWRAAFTQLSFEDLRVALLFVGVAVAACLLPAQADTYWHLRAGQDLFRTGHVPMMETYSHSARGRPWPNHEWLWQAASYACYRLGGMPLLTGMGALLCTASCWISFRLMRATPALNLALAFFGIALASVVWALRPQVASLFFFTALVALLGRDCFWPLPFLFLVWANLHGAVALGGAALVTATLLAGFCDRRRFIRLATVTVVCGLATVVTPLGIRLWWFVGESMARSRRNQILEWLPSYPRGPVEIAFWLASIGLVLLVVSRWRRLQSWEDRLTVSIALLLVPLAARAVRNIAPFALVWMPAVSRLLRHPPRVPTPHPEELGGAEATPSTDHPTVNVLVLAVASLAAVGVVAMTWTAGWEPLGWRPLPPGLAPAVAACHGNLYNRYNEGGYLIWFVRGSPVFVDSRQDPYPADLLAAAGEAERSGDFTPLFRRYKIACAMLPTTSPVSRQLTKSGWLDLYRDATWLVARSPSDKLRSAGGTPEAGGPRRLD